ncbi:hypothetical protein AB0M45_29955 [Nocardia sp. NPDC051787]|uniref:hypothetical protein n=1 Tax=Nocardia sp. NPDC051787 TaxID=3155415 RepID=UPI00341207EB
MTINLGSDDWAPDACTLPVAERPLRVAEFDRFFATSVRRSVRPEPTRLELLLADGTEAAGRDLAALESSCCSFFFAFGFDAGESGTLMRITVPTEHVDVLDALEARVDAALDAGVGEDDVAHR